MMSAHRRLAALCVAATFLACFAGPSAEAQPDQVAVAPPGPPPPGAPPPPPGSGVPDGQWVYTQQYGWIWMTTGDQFTYVPPDGTGEPLEYVYYGPAGWTWIAAPWVWGYGPRPYWGRARPERFAWYRHGYWRSPQRWHYAAAPERGEVAHRGVRSAPAPRPSRGEARPAPRAQGRGGRGEGRGRDGGGGREEGGGREGGGGERGEGGRGGGRGER
jgi:uncharacterized membrane protein YgcG